MEPRLIGRGKVIFDSLPNAACYASMEPRLIGRGKFGAFQTQDLARIASMEPRLIGRGKDQSHPLQKYTDIKLQWSRDLLVAERQRRVHCLRLMHSFNGAATYWSRKEADRNICQTDLACFNGAATYWSRKDPRSKPAAASESTLQWSRDLLVAERAK